MLTGINGERAALRGLRMSLHSRREIRVSGVVIRQKAALVFITGLGLPERTTKPWAVARCRARWAFSRNSFNTNSLIQLKVLHSLLMTVNTNPSKFYLSTSSYSTPVHSHWVYLGDSLWKKKIKKQSNKFRYAKKKTLPFCGLDMYSLPCLWFGVGRSPSSLVGIFSPPYFFQ